MKQVTLNMKTGEVEITEVPIPSVKDKEVLVHNEYSLISGGTELSLIQLGKKSLLGKARERPDLASKVISRAKRDGIFTAYQQAMSRLDRPEPLGYSCAGEIIKLGQDIKDLKIGDKVACGGAGYASHAEFVVIPRNLCVKLPIQVSCRDACFTTIGSIALQGIRNADIRLGENVVIIGLGLIGQLTVQLLKASGCNVIGIDIDQDKVDLALKLGADKAFLRNLNNLEEKILEICNGDGADAVLLTAATSSSDPIEFAGNILRDKGRVVVIGNVGMNIPRDVYYKKELDVIVSRSYGPGRYDRNYEEKGFDYPVGFVRWTENRNMKTFVDLLEKKKLMLNELVSHCFEIDDAKKAYDLIERKNEFFMAILLQYKKESDQRDIYLYPIGKHSSSDKRKIVNVGVIGAGNYATSTLLPNLRKIKSINFKCLADISGLLAESTAKKFHFDSYTTDYKKILNDEKIDAVFVLTSNSSHAKFTTESLNSGKHVFVEKPLALSEEQLKEIVDSYTKNKKVVMVGFNRRYAPLTLKIKEFFKDRTGPMVCYYRVNAEKIPSDHWIYDEEQGSSRIISEACHFIDYLTYIIDSPITNIDTDIISSKSTKSGKNDNFIIKLTFEDGSIGAIIYTNKGDDTYSKEMCEFFADSSVAFLKDFRTLELISKGRRKTFKKRFSLNKGHIGELQRFIEMITSGNLNEKDVKSYILSSAATLNAWKNKK
jgi:predicted dehydrogenase/threonine dehydrogenase-like Zn-dependent dehydrogenase